MTDPAGKVLYASNFDAGFEGWETADGAWGVKDGALQQSAGGPNVRAVTGDPAWTDYTLTLQARKLGGEEGFLILFHSPSVQSPAWWNLGGWRNTAHAIQNADVSERRIPGNIETGRWYDIRIELAGGNIKAFLDGQLIDEATIEPLPTLYAAAGRLDASGELVLELVNPFREPCRARIRLAGQTGPLRQGRLITLAHADPAAENSLAAPQAVVPREESLQDVAAEFSHTVPAYSLEILRLSTGKK